MLVIVALADPVATLVAVRVCAATQDIAIAKAYILHECFMVFCQPDQQVHEGECEAHHFESSAFVQC